ncbi:nipped-B-like protein B isoform X2 [Macrosteles quadrilineatus]|uniref:nipped-B-like protein B isoform X2 n=1 Tax=Macrosteles quadrilineatus TaxID=74068 RepID=UPI0023E13EF9|nr:nipped-B-like protein B isoform X2 [Macrosteles quadrilineatus]XP_054290247.1 nipped-B-like protein B isoform X2 [Macrosteles quadrilineatus]
MSNENERYLTQEESDPERLDNILRHSVRRDEPPIMLVQLPGAEEHQNLEFPLRQRRATIVNTASTGEVTLPGEKTDPFESYFRKNNQNLRTSLHQERAVDDLTSQRKSIIYGDQMEELVLMSSNGNANRNPGLFNTEVPDSDRHHMVELRSKKSQKVMEKEQRPDSGTEGKTCLYPKTKIAGQTEKGESYYEIKGCKNYECKGYDVRDEEKGRCTIDNLIKKQNVGTTGSLYAKASIMGGKTPINKTLMGSIANANEAVTAMAVAFTPTDHSTPFSKDLEEMKAHPSSRVKVLIMLDEWDEGLEDGDFRKGDGRKGKYRDYDAKDGRRLSDGSSYDDIRREYIYDKPPLKNIDKSIKSGQSIDYAPQKYGGKESQGGRMPGTKDDDSYESNASKWRRIRDQEHDDGKSKRGTRTEYGDDGRKHGTKTKSRESYHDWSDGKISKQDVRAGDKEYAKKKHDSRGTRSTTSYDEGDKDGKNKHGHRSDSKDRDKKNYKDKGAREARDKSHEEDRNQKGENKDRGKTRQGRQDEEEDFDKNRGKERPKDGHDPTKYRMVTMPKSATTLTSRRRYHLQITDHKMKEPWFNSCFNISKENNVDFNYDGPVKITPYYIGDKFY